MLLSSDTVPFFSKKPEMTDKSAKVAEKTTTEGGETAGQGEKKTESTGQRKDLELEEAMRILHAYWSKQSLRPHPVLLGDPEESERWVKQ